MDTNVSRRSFVAGAASAAAVAASGVASTAFADFEPIPAELPDAEPIPPLDPPAAWDEEADVVVVGMGGGGLSASLYLAEAGVKVIALEKQPDVGGATEHACGFFCLPGSSQLQAEAEYAYPEYPFDADAFMRAILPYYQYTVDDDLIKSVAVLGGQAIDWMAEHDENFGVRGGNGGFDMRIVGGVHPLGARWLCQDFKQMGLDAGVDLRLQTACDGLVMEDGRIVGVKTKKTNVTDGEEAYIKANKGVILCTGSFGMNRDMLAKYCPSAWRGASVGGPVPGATGECTRMAIGAGADMAGFDSWCCWEAYPDRYRMGDGSWFTYHWDGSVILCRQPWLTIDKRGKRVGYYSQSSVYQTKSYGADGDFINAAAQMSRMGGAAYCFFDANYEENVMKLHPLDAPFLGDRAVLTPERIAASGIDAEEAAKYCSADWRDDVAAALERGEIKKADTLEELAEQLGLDPEVVVKAVEDWNRICEQGEDDVAVYAINPAWLIPIKDAPYYGARISGGVGKTFCGPRVTEKLEVVDTNGHTIPGLYAHFLTAGGICGESCFNGTTFNTSIYGGNALSWVSGYICARSVLGELD